MAHDPDPNAARLVDELMQRGILSDPAVSHAMRLAPRHLFVETEDPKHAYEDHPLGIGHGQTISAPHMVAIMAQALELGAGMRVLEIGTGSGWHAAVVARLVEPGGHVNTVEVEPELALRARRRLDRAGIRNVEVHVGDGSQGVPQHAPYDRVYLTCAAPSVPGPLWDQLQPDGILLGPFGQGPTRLLRYKRAAGGWNPEDLGACAFVPLRSRPGDA